MSFGLDSRYDSFGMGNIVIVKICGCILLKTMPDVIRDNCNIPIFHGGKVDANFEDILLLRFARNDIKKKEKQKGKQWDTLFHFLFLFLNRP